MPPRNIAFIVAHPDDVAFSHGGTALLLKEKYHLHVFCASRGSRGYDYDGPGLTPPNPDVAARRSAEEQASCDMLGASLTFLEQVDGEIFAGKEVCTTVAEHLDRLKPVAVFTHGPEEKADHAATYAIALKAMHLADIFWSSELYMPVRYGETRYMRSPDVYVNITSVIAQKQKLVRCHTSQRHGERMVDGILDCDRHLGRMAWCEYAEAYMLSLPLMATRWERPAGSILLGL